MAGLFPMCGLPSQIGELLEKVQLEALLLCLSVVHPQILGIGAAATTRTLPSRHILQQVS